MVLQHAYFFHIHFPSYSLYKCRVLKSELGIEALARKILDVVYGVAKIISGTSSSQVGLIWILPRYNEYSSSMWKYKRPPFRLILMPRSATAAHNGFLLNSSSSSSWRAIMASPCLERSILYDSLLYVVEFYYASIDDRFWRRIVSFAFGKVE